MQKKHPHDMRGNALSDSVELTGPELSEEHTYITLMIQIVLAAKQYEEWHLFKLKVEVISKSVKSVL